MVYEVLEDHQLCLLWCLYNGSNDKGEKFPSQFFLTSGFDSFFYFETKPKTLQALGKNLPTLYYTYVQFSYICILRKIKPFLTKS